jgi:tRNA-Thr(GGU) m(6)t(6)A37 methyltransferase TsaA
MRPIGVIHTPFYALDQVPIQASRSSSQGQVEVFREFVDGLEDLAEFSHLYLLYVFHRSAGSALRVQPFLDDQLRGVFATRHPSRPNPIGLSVVELCGRRDNVLDVARIDVLDGTPLLDIKPYVPEFDQPVNVKTGWYQRRPRA